jgi:hypothetical protein
LFIQKGFVEPYPGKRSVWILDGAQIHFDDSIVDYLYSMRILVFFLLAYCSFYNPIEVFFGVIKRKCKKYYHLICKRKKSLLLSVMLFSFSLMDMSKIFVFCGYHFDGYFNPITNYLSLLNKNTI